MNPPESLTIASTTDSRGTVLHLQGRLDPTGSQELDRRFNALFESGQHRLVLDCAGLDHIASYGLRSLLTAAKRATAAGGGIAFCGEPQSVAQIFSYSGFDQLFSSYPNSDDALASFA